MKILFTNFQLLIISSGPIYPECALSILRLCSDKKTGDLTNTEELKDKFKMNKPTPSNPVRAPDRKSSKGNTSSVSSKFGSNHTDPILDQDFSVPGAYPLVKFVQVSETGYVRWVKSIFSDSDKCVTADGEEGLCVPYHQCDSQGLIDNTTVIDLREKSCPHHLMKCCLRSETIKKPKKVEPSNSQCGWGNPGASIFRTNTNNINRKTYADYGEFPWMVALIRKGGSQETWSQKHYLGGGSIIHPSVVITAAHKVDRSLPEEIKCRAGEWDTQTNLELYPYQERDVKKIIMHEEYYSTPIYNDVSLLVLVKPYQLQDAPHIGVACLAPELPHPGTQCFSMGWGVDFQQKNKYAVILKKVQLPYVPHDQCEASLKRSRFTETFILHQSHICAGGTAAVDTCKGDGGSPLVCPIMEGAIDIRYAVYGIVAFGVGCGTPYPMVYVNVPHLYSWVGDKMNGEGFGTTSYKY